MIGVRRVFCQLAVKRMVYPGTEEARYLGVTTSAVNRLAVSEESQELRNMPKFLQNLRPIAVLIKAWMERFWLSGSRVKMDGLFLLPEGLSASSGRVCAQCDGYPGCGPRRNGPRCANVDH